MQVKEGIIGNEARLKIKAGIDKACAYVGPTLGAVGMAALIDFDGLDPIVSDDGVTILKNLEFKDKYENMGLKMLRKAAVRTSAEGGDGTATTTVLTTAVVEEAFQEVNGDPSKIQEVKARLAQGLEDTLSELSNIKREVKEEDIERIATISSLDTEVAKLIAGVIKEVGVNGVVTVEKGSKIGYSSEVVKGARFNSGIIAPYFINNPETEECILENPYIFLVDRRVSINEQIKSVMDSIQTTGNKSVLIVADDVDGLALASLIKASKTVAQMNPNGQVTQGTWDICCVKNPYSASRAKDFLFDIAALTGATVVSEEAGMRLDSAKVEHCGQADKVIVTKDTCTIIGGKPSDALKTRIASVEKQIEETTSEYQKNMLEERLACLTGGIGVIRVGTYTDTDFHAKKLKFDNAINSTQAALQEGILPGGGSALAVIKVSDPIFKSALKAPLRQMAKNAGMYQKNYFWSKPSVEWLVDEVRSQNTENVTGYDFKKRNKASMIEAGIIDPFKVVRLALESAVHIASTLITIEPAIVTETLERN